MTKHIRNMINLILSLCITFFGCMTILNYIQHNDGDVLGAVATPIFSNSYIMSDLTFKNSDIFTDENSIQNYLEREKSPLQDYWDKGHRASYWIWNASQGITSAKYGYFPQINPGVILAYLEKEQSLISLTNYDTLHDSDKRIKFAMGYGCPDDKDCDPEYQGFANQVNWGAFQLQFNYTKSKDYSDSDSYKVGNTITTLDGYQVFLSNAATAANYRYTPHVYWGNYSLWKVIVGNGWGQSKTHYYYAELDNANLNTKTEIVVPTTPSGDRENIQELLNKKFKFGDESEEIRTLQKFLKNKGYFTFPTPTGVFGSWTAASQEAYLKDNKITGKKDCSSMFNQNWTVGDTSDSIKELQICLRDARVFNHPEITGYFGSVTNQALQTVLNKNVGVKTNCEELKNKTWNIGQNGYEVQKLQKCMQDAGYFAYPEGITGTFGNYTNGKLSEWRNSSNGTIRIVFNNNSCDTLKQKSWKVGEQSTEIEGLQKCMQTAGTFKHSFGATGYFGEVTKKALIDWRGWF